MLRKIDVPESERANADSLGVGTGRHINFQTPGIRFVARSSGSGSQQVLDTRDPVVQILRQALGAGGSIYVVSKNVVLI
jgi:hypothetical protein